MWCVCVLGPEGSDYPWALAAARVVTKADLEAGSRWLLSTPAATRWRHGSLPCHGAGRAPRTFCTSESCRRPCSRKIYTNAAQPPMDMPPRACADQDLGPDGRLVDLGCLLCNDGDLPEASPSWSDRSGEFWKASPVNVNSAHLCFYSDHLDLEGATQSSVFCYHQVTFALWWSQRRRISWRPDCMTSNGGLSLCTFEGLTWCSGLHSSSMKVGATTQVKFRVLPFRVKIKGLVLIGCAPQWPCWRHCF
jgi:hypothetical protein